MDYKDQECENCRHIGYTEERGEFCTLNGLPTESTGPCAKFQLRETEQEKQQRSNMLYVMTGLIALYAGYRIVQALFF
jgi:hypothetical protein